VVEFLTNDLNICYVELSRLLGLKHEAFVPPESSQWGTFPVDTDMVLRILHKHL